MENGYKIDVERYHTIRANLKGFGHIMYGILSPAVVLAYGMAINFTGQVTPTGMRDYLHREWAAQAKIAEERSQHHIKLNERYMQLYGKIFDEGGLADQNRDGGISIEEKLDAYHRMGIETFSVIEQNGKLVDIKPEDMGLGSSTIPLELAVDGLKQAIKSFKSENTAQGVLK